jgi:hypothetical protein
MTASCGTEEKKGLTAEWSGTGVKLTLIRNRTAPLS